MSASRDFNKENLGSGTGADSPKQGKRSGNSSEGQNNNKFAKIMSPENNPMKKSPPTKTTTSVYKDNSNVKNGNQTKKISTGEPFYKGCEYRCKTCDKVYGSVEQIRIHLRKSHKMGNDRDNYDMTRVEYFDCVICGANMLRDYLVIKTHVKSKHKMGMVEYAKDYVNPCLGIE